MKKISLVLTIFFALFITSCSKKGYIDVKNLNFWIKNCSTPFEVQFYLEVGYEPSEVTYLWDFGDGQTSSEREPVHVYQNTGKYTVKLKIVNYKTTVEKSLVIDVNQNPMTPQLDFSFVSTKGKFYAPCQIEFYNNSQYASNFFWSFGDLTGSSDDSPTHIYQNPGTYSIKLNAICGDTTTQVYQLTILPPPTKISVDVIQVWLPDGFGGKWYDLEYYCGIHQETPTNLPAVQASSFPFSWTIGKNLYFFSGTYNDESLYFEVWEEYNNQAPVYSFGEKFSEIKNNFYPDTLSFSGSTGFSARVLLSYGN